MIALRITPSFNMTLDDVIAMFRTNQPTGLIADELLRSTSVMQAMEKDSAFYNAVKDAEVYFSSDDFWTAPPQALAHMIEKLRADLMLAQDDAAAKSMLLEMILNTGPEIPRSRKVG